MDIGDLFGKAMKPEMLMSLMQGMLSPSQKALLFSLPKVVTNSYDLSKKPLPKIAYKRQGNKLAVVYEFPTEQDAEQYEKAEIETLELVQMLNAAKEKKNADRPTA